MEKQHCKTRKGGAEKLREKKVKSLKSDADKCRKLTDLFGSSAARSANANNVHGVVHAEEDAAAPVQTRVAAEEGDSDSMADDN
ncbi:UNVERIFIED_CONTAM: hypothetical protein FKN15_078551 [Acipenser sinensis]